MGSTDGWHNSKNSLQDGGNLTRSQADNPRFNPPIVMRLLRIFSVQTIFMFSMPVSTSSTMCPLRNLSINWFPYIPYSSPKSQSIGEERALGVDSSCVISMSSESD